jgi:hypothetical protein
MSTLTIRLPATKHQRLKDFARARGVSLNKLIEEWATVALAQLDAENHYRLRARRGRPEGELSWNHAALKVTSSAFGPATQGQVACALSRMPNAPTIFVTVSKLGLPFGDSAL